MHVVLTEEPALLVANHGELVTAQIVIALSNRSGLTPGQRGKRSGTRESDSNPFSRSVATASPTCGTPSAVPEATRAR